MRTSHTFEATDGRESAKPYSPYTVSSAALVALANLQSKFITLTIADLATRTCEKTYCLCAVIAMQESQKSIGPIAVEDYAGLLGNTSEPTND